MIVGFVAGAISALGFLYLTPYLKAKIGLHDTCGVHNLHGIPGIIGGIISAITADTAGRNFGDRFNDIFVEGANGRTPRQQAGY